MEPPNKGHVGGTTIIYSAVLSFVERLPSFRCSRIVGKQFLGVLFVERSIILCPYLGGSTVVKYNIIMVNVIYI